MSVNLSPVAGAAAQFLDNSGNVLTGGKLYTYLAGTTTPAATYTSSTGTTFHSNPIILDAAGRVPAGGEIWLSDNVQYKFVLKDANEVLIGTWDNLVGINSNFVNYTSQEEIIVATAGQTVFNLTTVTYVPGTNSLQVFVDGVNQYDGISYAYVETDATTVTFTAGLHVGALVKFTTAVSVSAGSTNANLVLYNEGATGAVDRTVESKLQEAISVKDFGAVGDGVTDDTAAIDAAITSLATTGGSILFPYGTYKVTYAIDLVDNLDLIGAGKPTINCTVAGQNIFSGDGTNNVTITGIKFNGAGSATAPLNSVGGYASTSTGLVTIVDATDITVSNCEFGNFYSGLSLLSVQRAQVTNNYIHNWLVYGVLGSLSDNLSIDYNNIIGCDQTGGVNAYGVMITGNTVGSNLASANSISFNNIWDIPSWDAIMTHDCNGLRIIGNDMRNVRIGVDASKFATLTMDNVQISNNYIKATTTDTWGGTAALMAGILFQGPSNADVADTVIISNNIIDGFFNLSGSPTLSGNPSNISAGSANNINIVGNTVKNVGVVGSNAGIYVYGTSNRTVITGNNLQGNMVSGGVLLTNTISDTCTIVGNTIKQDAVANGISTVTCTITYLTIEGNATTAAYGTSGSTITNKSINMGSLQSKQTLSVTGLANGTSVQITPDFTVTGVLTVDTCTAFLPGVGSVYLSALCVGADTVRVFLLNQRGSALTLTNEPITINVVKYR